MTPNQLVAELRRLKMAQLENVNALYRLEVALIGATKPNALNPDTGLPDDLISTGAAAKIAKCGADTVRSWCRVNVLSGDDGFAVKIGSRWQVSRSRFLIYLK